MALRGVRLSCGDQLLIHHDGGRAARQSSIKG